MTDPYDPKSFPPWNVDPYEGIESTEGIAEESLDSSVIKRRATQGVGLLVLQMLGLQVLTLGATIVIARILTVADYGVFAVAFAIQQVGYALVELGVSASIINRDRPPNRHEQRAVTGFVFISAISLCLLIGLTAYVILPQLGISDNLVRQAFVACLALPILSMRTIPTVLLERRLRYGRITAITSMDTIMFNLTALVGALLGWGGFALAAGIPAGALAGMVAAFALQPSARGITWDFGVIRPMISFGSQVSARTGIVLIRDLSFVSLISLIGGQVAAGYYSMSQRVLGVPTAFSLALARIGFPAMARSDSDVRSHQTVQSISVAAVATGLPLAISAAVAAPLLTVLFGERWAPASEVVIPSAAGLLLMSSIGAIISGLFLSGGNAKTPMLSSVVEAIVLCGSVVLLLQWSTTFGIGIAVFVGAVAAVAVLMTKADRGVKMTALPVIRSLLIGAIAAATGYFLPSGGDLTRLLAGTALTGVTWFLLHMVFSRSELSLLLRLLRRGLRRNRPPVELGTVD